MTVVIFGGGGFVGLNIADAMLRDGRAVVLVDLEAPPKADLERLPQAGLRVETADVTNVEVVRSLIQPGVDAVIYGAAITADAARDAAMPERIIETNLLGLMHVLRASRDAGVRRVVNLSSTAAYGDAAFGPSVLDEGDIDPDPITLYSISKFATERVTRRLAGLWDCDFRSVRLSGVFGRFERQTSFRDTPSPMLQIANLALAGKPAILDRPGTRDWTYAPDVAAAVKALVEASDPKFDLYNISAGFTFSALAFGDMLASKVPGFVCRLAENGEEPTVSMHAIADRAPLSIERLTSDLKFVPAFDLERSVDDYWAWLGTH